MGVECVSLFGSERCDSTTNVANEVVVANDVSLGTPAIREQGGATFKISVSGVRPVVGVVALAVERGADYVDVGKTIYPHSALGESVGIAAEIAHGSNTDVPPMRRRHRRVRQH